MSARMQQRQRTNVIRDRIENSAGCVALLKKEIVDNEITITIMVGRFKEIDIDCVKLYIG